MSRPTDEQQLDKFISTLRDLGGASGNGTLRHQLGWSDAEYWRVRDKAVDDGRLVLGRGRGGSVRLVDDDDDDETPRVDTAPPPSAHVADQSTDRELDLYGPCKATLEKGWARERGLHDCHVEITAMQGRRGTGGAWTRPDIVAVSMRTFKHWPGRYFDLWTFEIKPQWSLSVTGIYEAAAHSRCATHSYCVFHVPNSPSEEDTGITRLVDEAQRLQIGLIFFTDPTDYSTWDLRVVPVRKEPDPALLEEFIATQLSDTGKEKLLRWSK